jgi:hypothetical protein
LLQIMAALVIAAGSTTQAAIGGTALRRAAGDPAPFDDTSQMLTPSTKALTNVPAGEPVAIVREVFGIPLTPG